MKRKNLLHINGVGPSKVFLPEGPYLLVLDFLEKRFPRGTRAGWENRMLAGRVFDELGHPLTPDASYLPRRMVYYYREAQENFVIPFQESILYEDDYLLVADKPHFLPVTPVGPYIQETLLVRLRNLTGIDSLSAAHRLDLETAGLVIFTKQAQTRDLYASLFRKQVIQKTYLAVADYTDQITWPHIRQSRIEKGARFMQMQESEGVANALTTIQMIQHDERFALYQLRPQTGKKHQLRVHMSALGIPIRHDQIYPQMMSYTAPEHRLYETPLQLLAKELRFTDPVSQKNHHFVSQLRLDWPIRH
jgi:tRNA pseudouridine32 synthase/23S rRNA pseudouridine746 synthase